MALKDFFKKKNNRETTVTRNRYVQTVAEETGWTYEYAEQEMNDARQQLGISYKRYCTKKYYKHTRARQERMANSYHREKRKKEKQFQKIALATGMSVAEIKGHIKELDQLGITRVDVKNYKRYGMYSLSENEVIHLLGDIHEMKELTKSLQEKLLDIDKGNLMYRDIQPEYDKYLEIIRRTLTPALSETLKTRIKRLLPDIDDHPDRLQDILVDMEMCVQLLRFTPAEYNMYHLYRSSLPEKREYVSDKVRSSIVSPINKQDVRDIVDNKLNTYNALKQFFHRDVSYIKGMQDLAVFEEFVSKHPVFVCKPVNDAMGRGVSLVTVDPSSDLKAELAELLEEKRTFLMEERILSNDTMARFNGDSLNTVRLMAYYDGEKARPVTSFMRTGRPGSFVDNAGAGGIFASVDIETGILNSDGGDEAGHLYKEHPDSHLSYKGFQIPCWDQAIQLACDACKALGTINFIGWDLALNQDDQWVIVEGNAFPQWVHQGPLLHGLRSYFLDAIGYEYD